MKLIKRVINRFIKIFRKNSGVKDLYFISCTDVLAETNLYDPAWWTALMYENKSDKTIDNASE